MDTRTALLTLLSVSLASGIELLCPSALTPAYPAPSLAKGYVARLVANGLTSPRGIEFDSNGALMVVEQGKGISALNIRDAGNDCLSVASKKLVVDLPSLNHGMQMSTDGKTLYASSGNDLYSWGYSSVLQANTSAARTLVTGMSGSDHTSRTLMLSKKAPGMIAINRGSNSNIDTDAANVKSGHAQVKAFNISRSAKTYDFNTQGTLMSWGTRNSVGLAEEPTTGRLYTVENSADQITRYGSDVHTNNPAEEMNLLGYLDGTKSANQGRNFGYPDCFTAWQPSELPKFKGDTGSMFQLGDNPNDAACANRQGPRLSFQAHTAPLDLLFNPTGSTGWITFHGSWNRSPQVGYNLGMVKFAKGEPVAPRNSRTAVIPIMSNADVTKCPGSCFRPVGLAWDKKGRLFMSSDLTGEIWAITRTDGQSVMQVGASNATGTVPDAENSSSSSSGPAATTTTGDAGRISSGGSLILICGLLALLAFCVR